MSVIPPDSTPDAPLEPDSVRTPHIDGDDSRAHQRRARLDVVFRTYYVPLVQYACTFGRHELADAEDAVGDTFF
ncbi:MAG TPA: hypothetical protein VNU46_06620, partial [Gemmatimonadaceae bacterium]|nr:hypothetical protein [Gemmatimonadaceae bacterium]